MANQALGNVVDWLGTALGAEEKGWSEGIAGGPTINTGITESSQAAGYVPYTPADYSPNVPTNIYGGSGGNVLGATDTSVDQGGGTQEAPTSVTTRQQTDPFAGGLTGEQVAAMGLNPDAMISSGGKFYSSGGSGETGGNYDQQISDMYAPYLRELGNIEGGLATGKAEDIASTEAGYTSSGEIIGREESDLLAGLQLQEDRIQKSGVNAADEARRAYNDLIQQGRSRYGMGSSAGGAISELIGRQYMGTSGDIREQTREGVQDIGLEIGKVGTYISGKKTDLDNWRREALGSINKAFRTGMENIALQRGEIESNKVVARQQLMQDAIDRTRQVADRAEAFSQNLSTFAVEQLQQSSGRTLTPKEIASVVNDMMSQTLSTSQKQSVYQSQLPYKAGTYADDEISKLGTPFTG